jgi:hypothetical protein
MPMGLLRRDLSSSCKRCSVVSMTRDALAEELSSLIERYEHSTFGLETFVDDALKSIDQNRNTAHELIERFDAISRSEEPPAHEPGVKTVKFELSDTESQLVVEALSSQSRYYELHPRMLLEMSLTYAAALFDALISDALLVIYKHMPQSLRSGRTLTAAEVLSFRDRNELIEDLARREIHDLMYKGVEKQFDFFRKTFGVDVFADNWLKVSIADLAAVRARRNLVTHNNGVVSAEYVAQVDPASSIGDGVVVDAVSAASDRTALHDVATALVANLQEKLAPPG